MISFKEITLEDKNIIEKYTLESQRRNCDLSFANICSWNFLYQTKYAIVNDFLVFRFYLGEQLAYMMPIGKGDMKSVIELLVEDADAIGAKFYMVGVCTENKDELQIELPNYLSFSMERDYADYVYLRTDLATLKGKKYQSKRNHINKFKAQYPDYEYKELTPQLVSECLKLEEEWCRANNCEEQTALAAERRSMTFALSNMESLGITGGVLHVGGKIVAFTYGCIISNDTWDVCVEKADTTVEGSYTMINFEYANHIDPSFIYINREEDLGLDGLRKAKLSYHPIILLEKWIAEKI